TCGALQRLNAARVPTISVMTHPTTGGVTASFASVCDLLVAEPGALIGFAGPRVIATTIKKELPKGFQRSEFLLEKGQVDRIVPRAQMRDELARLLAYATGADPVAAFKPQVVAAPAEAEAVAVAAGAGTVAGADADKPKKKSTAKKA
ncbi:MAG: acetyl-CoA carboxylase carboxyl transferase subunit beta, partial [Planctomycetota bacterium]